MKILKIIVNMLLLLFLLYCTLTLSKEGLNVWPFIVAVGISLFVINKDEFFDNIKYLKIGKDGVELEKITAAAHKTINEAHVIMEQMRKLADLIIPSTAETIAFGGSFGYGFSNEDLLNFFNNTRSLFKIMRASSVEQQNTKNAFDKIFITILLYNNVITNAVRNKKVDKKYESELVQLMQEINIDGLEKRLGELCALSAEDKAYLSEAKYFKENGEFKNINLAFKEMK